MITEKILVVDDEENVCRSVKKILVRKGYEVDNALSVPEAVNKLKETTFHLVITDLMMPQTSGMELLQIVRDHYPELQVIMITGYASIESAVKATKLGAAGFLAKPFTPDELAGVTATTLANRKGKQVEKSAPPAASRDDAQVDVDMPFDRKELERSTSPEYVESLTRSDVPLAKKATGKAYCYTGKRECARVVKEGRECPGVCLIEKKEKERAVKGITRVTRVVGEVMDVDMPFPMAEVNQIMDADYMACFDRSDMPRAGLYGHNQITKHTVLVVDDEPIACHSVRKVLARESCAVEEAFDVDVAMQKMRLNKYDLVLLDLRMPRRSGLEVLASIKKLYPQVPVVIVSGFVSIENAIEATKLGAYDVLPKPYTPKELTKLAKEALAA